jgi:hypothetical protein
MRHRLTVALVVLATALIAASSATAATVGDDLTHDPGFWGGSVVMTQGRMTDGSGAGYTGFPVGGVLTSISVKTQGSAGTVVVYVLRKKSDPGPGTVAFENVAPSTAIAVPAVADLAGQVTTVLTRRLVQAGDRFGLFADTGIKGFWFFSAPEMDYCYYTFTPHVDGTEQNYFSPSCNNYMPLVRGTVEADADGDGYGDETQDACPAEVARQTAPCSADIGVFVNSARWIGRSRTRKTVKYEVHNFGPSTASNIVLQVTKPSFVDSISATGCTLSADRRACSIASLTSGASQFVELTARSKRSRKRWSKRRNLSLRLIGLDQSDANATNNDAVYALKLRMRRR